MPGQCDISSCSLSLQSVCNGCQSLPKINPPWQYNSTVLVDVARAAAQTFDIESPGPHFYQIILNFKGTFQCISNMVIVTLYVLTLHWPPHLFQVKLLCKKRTVVHYICFPNVALKKHSCGG